MLEKEKLTKAGGSSEEAGLVEAMYPNLKKKRISVFGTVRKMREQRWSMVKKQVQYGFIYDYLERWVQKHLIDFESFDDI